MKNERKIEITPEFLTELKGKVKKATIGPWSVTDEPATNYNTPVISTKWIEDIAEEQNLEYIIASNHAVILALINKIENDNAMINTLRNEAEIQLRIRQIFYKFLFQLQVVLEIKDVENVSDDLKLSTLFDAIMNRVKELKHK